jgi:hypothetical protein
MQDADFEGDTEKIRSLLLEASDTIIERRDNEASRLQRQPVASENFIRFPTWHRQASKDRR